MQANILFNVPPRFHCPLISLSALYKTAKSQYKNTFAILFIMFCGGAECLPQILGKTTKMNAKTGLQKTKYHTTVPQFRYAKSNEFLFDKNRRAWTLKKSGERSKATHHFEEPKPAWINVMEFMKEWARLCTLSFRSCCFKGASLCNWFLMVWLHFKTAND